MANEQKLTTVGQMRTFAEQQDARDDAQEERLQQLEKENDSFLTTTAQTLTDAQKAQVRTNIGAASAGVYLDDINKLVTDGLYRVDANTNLPSELYFGQVIVSRGVWSDGCAQIGMSHHTGIMMYRSGYGDMSNPTWTEWKTAVSVAEMNTAIATATRSITTAQIDAILDA